MGRKQRETIPGKGVNFFVTQKFAKVDSAGRMTLFPGTKNADRLARDNSVRPCFDCLALTELARLGEPKCLYGEKLAELRG